MRLNGLEVTHMFAIASAAISIPFERLRKPTDGVEHPSLDRKRYQKAVGKFANLCAKEFLGSTLWKKDGKSWKFGHVGEEDIKSGPANWESNSGHLRNDIKVEEILEHIRNGLAHGSIFTTPDSSDQIENILFLSKDKDAGCFSGDYKLLIVSTRDFYRFLVKWIDFLKHELKMLSAVD